MTLNVDDLSVNDHSNSDLTLPNYTNTYVFDVALRDTKYLNLNVIEILKDKLFFACQVQREFFKC